MISKKYVLLLIFSLFLIPGCLDDIEVQSSELNNTGISITYIDSQASNFPSIIVFAASMNGNVSEIGVDYDLDGIIDETIEFTQPIMINVDQANQKPHGDGDRCIFSFGLHASDDQGHSAYQVGLRESECQ